MMRSLRTRAGILVFLIAVMAAMAVADPAIDTSDPHIGRALIQAAQLGDLAAMKKLLDAGVNPNSVDGADNLFPLYGATNSNQVEAVKLLLAHGADPKQRTSTGDRSIDRACWLGEKEIADLLAAAGSPRFDLVYFSGTNDVAGLKNLEGMKPFTPHDVVSGIYFALASGSGQTFDFLWPKLSLMDAEAQKHFERTCYDAVGRGGHVSQLQRLEQLVPPTAELEGAALMQAVGGDHSEMENYLWSKPGVREAAEKDPPSSFHAMAELMAPTAPNVNNQGKVPMAKDASEPAKQ